jgi:hypothetical protein
MEYITPVDILEEEEQELNNRDIIELIIIKPDILKNKYIQQRLLDILLICNSIFCMTGQ